MALKKSELYSSLWSGCDELRGSMDASQYKDYVLSLLFVKYVSDKYAGQPFAPITIPPGASFADMVQLKGTNGIGDQINKKILGPLAQANNLSDMPDWNDPNKLGSPKEMVERITNLIAIFENPALDFSKNRSEGDDLLGDAYEHLMRHFATESGKSKGQFYTPAEVSRVIAQVLDIRNANTSNDTTVYDPTCGSGSLLLKIGHEASHGKDVRVTLYGQEKDSSTAGLARMTCTTTPPPRSSRATRWPILSSKRGTRSRPSTTSSPIRHIVTSAGALDSILKTTPLSASRATEFRQASKATTPTSYISCARCEAVAKVLASFLTESCFGAMPRLRSGGTSFCAA